MPEAIFIQEVTKLQGVSRAWFEWSLLEDGESHTRTLVVEVETSTDPNSSEFDSSLLDDIVEAIKAARTTMFFSNLRVVPKGIYGA